jgi:hypothetical protein
MTSLFTQLLVAINCIFERGTNFTLKFFQMLAGFYAQCDQKLDDSNANLSASHALESSGGIAGSVNHNFYACLLYMAIFGCCFWLNIYHVGTALEANKEGSLRLL